jgi:hypothetical protein
MHGCVGEAAAVTSLITAGAPVLNVDSGLDVGDIQHDQQLYA